MLKVSNLNSEEEGVEHFERGQFVVFMPPDGFKLRFVEKDDAANFCAENGRKFFFEMDDAGPFFEAPRLCWFIEQDPTDNTKLVTISRQMDELECTCGGCSNGQADDKAKQAKASAAKKKSKRKAASASRRKNR